MGMQYVYNHLGVYSPGGGVYGQASNAAQRMGLPLTTLSSLPILTPILPRHQTRLFPARDAIQVTEDVLLDRARL